ncbi:hypothetical protein DVA86_15390 [Streptomyces armeniacus]|uniref:Uncharacterized protein n=1 Tax=Streptomyces armeniacus TaxID=83291 RepID=A0A345XQC1_9ACTN|nr:hypothetical protein [Streptomyces armeniacus]AXK33837.1 hypothetical protein DVA86_15390 [Streptomyces armeniacus]
MNLTGVAEFVTTERDGPDGIALSRPENTSGPDNAGGIPGLAAKPGAELGTSGTVRGLRHFLERHRDTAMVRGSAS